MMISHFLIHNKHLQTVFNIRKAYVRIIVKRQQLNIREQFLQPFADASAYKQFGNSVAIPAIQATAEKELQMLNLI